MSPFGECLRSPAGSPCGAFLFGRLPYGSRAAGGSLCSGAPAGRPSPSARWRCFPCWLGCRPPPLPPPRPAPARVASSLRAACARSGLPRLSVRFGLQWLRARGVPARYAAPARPCARSPLPPCSLRVGCSPSVLGCPPLRWLRPAGSGRVPAGAAGAVGVLRGSHL